VKLEIVTEGGLRAVECDGFEVAEQREESGELTVRGQLARDSQDHCYVWDLYAARSGKVLAAYRHTYDGETRIDEFLKGGPRWLPVEHFDRACVRDRDLAR
jgi:hypothetical protein